MATRAVIGRENEDGTVTAVYCHWDGYLEHVGKMLLEWHDEPKVVDRIMELGDISALYPCLEAPEGHSFEKPVAGVTIFYGRDRGEKDVSAKTYKSIKDWQTKASDIWAEYLYLYKRDVPGAFPDWYYSTDSDGHFHKLTADKVRT